jgi:hypothetical protein
MNISKYVLVVLEVEAFFFLQSFSLWPHVLLNVFIKKGSRGPITLPNGVKLDQALVRRAGIELGTPWLRVQFKDLLLSVRHLGDGRHCLHLGGWMHLFSNGRPRGGFQAQVLLNSVGIISCTEPCM